MELVDFLRARLDVKANDAQRLAASRQGAAIVPVGDGNPIVIGGKQMAAEVEAERMLLDSVIPTMNDYENRIDEEWGTGGGEPASAAFLRAWARVYRTHPDFDQTWLED